MRRAIRTIHLPLMWITVCALTVGCSWTDAFAPREAADDTHGGVGPFAEDAKEVFGAKPGDDGLVVLRLGFDVDRFLVPSDAMSDGGAEVWERVDELRLPPRAAALLAQNGFRIGVTNRAGGQAIRETLHRLDANVETMNHVAQSGVPLTLDLGAIGDDRTVFTIGRGGALQGNTFGGAGKLIHIDYEVTLGQTPGTTLRVTPEIFKENETPYWRLRDGDVRYQAQYEGKLYRELSAELNVADGETLVIGPADAEKRSLMLGSAMLSDVVAGRRWETLLCITPRIFRDANQQESP